MRGILSAFFFALVCGFVFAIATSAFAGQAARPEAPGKAVTVDVCGQCHGAEIVAP
jgi:cytochrome c553